MVAVTVAPSTRTRAMTVAFSGADCSGKSTQISILRGEFERKGGKTRLIWLRLGYTPGFCLLKSAFRLLVGRDTLPQGASPQRDRFMKSGWKRRLWLYCAFADMFFETAVRLRLLRCLNYSVICDRYIVDSEIDLALNFGQQAVAMWGWRFVKWAALRPEIHIFLDLPFEEQLQRAIAKHEPFPDSVERRRERAILYEEIKSRTPWQVVSTQTTESFTAAKIGTLIWNRLA